MSANVGRAIFNYSLHIRYVPTVFFRIIDDFRFTTGEINNLQHGTRQKAINCDLSTDLWQQPMLFHRWLSSYYAGDHFLLNREFTAAFNLSPRRSSFAFFPAAEAILPTAMADSPSLPFLPAAYLPPSAASMAMNGPLCHAYTG